MLSLSLSQYFQEVRDYVSSLCGCLREKETMIKELDNAMAAIRREACDAAWSRRVEAQVRQAAPSRRSFRLCWLVAGCH